ncbi:hypothetical protein TNIN_397481 [Trichonephila inaurata madagascariensis]|uniref:Uncharacterized protein n=1 Tax=Trichonephila inaurata madagascariensis TaxID=2747483 RepID=A0A8X6WRC3_9ARAC|nr:hypothetical protein TNIN_397481 [Trichonephila inaurata madagascariensis]
MHLFTEESQVVKTKKRREKKLKGEKNRIILHRSSILHGAEKGKITQFRCNGKEIAACLALDSFLPGKNIAKQFLSPTNLIRFLIDCDLLCSIEHQSGDNISHIASFEPK